MFGSHWQCYSVGECDRLDQPCPATFWAYYKILTHAYLLVYETCTSCYSTLIVVARDSLTSSHRMVLRREWKTKQEMSTTGSGSELDDGEELGDDDGPD